MFGDRMQTPAIPERVYALCKAVANKNIQERDLKEMLEPSHLGGTTVYFGIVRTAAEQLGLIQLKDGEISLAVSKDVVKDINAMRQYLNLHLESLNESLFYAVTQEYLDMNEQVLKYDNVSKMCNIIGKNIGKKVVEDDMRAWRFWVSFLGFGFMHDMIMLPNTSTFTRDLIEKTGIKKNVEYTISEFIEIIGPYSGIALHGAMKEKKLNYAFSNGLRLLHDCEYIMLQHKLDRGNMWSLYPIELHQIQSTVTHITVRG